MMPNSLVRQLEKKTEKDRFVNSNCFKCLSNLMKYFENTQFQIKKKLSFLCMFFHALSVLDLLSRDMQQ